MGTLPDNAFTCRDYPVTPTGDYGEIRVRRFIVDLTAAYWDCRDRLEALK